MNTTIRVILPLAALAMLATALGGCNYDPATNHWSWVADISAQPVKIPDPINLMLPKSIQFHPFTGERVFDESGGIKGIDVMIEAKDSFGDPTKAFGDFRFELYEYRRNNQDPRGKQLATWEEKLLDPKQNLLHWDSFTKAYRFKLQWNQPIAVGQKFVLVAVFNSPFTERKFAQKEFISGQ